jgi:hypothetical protein
MNVAKLVSLFRADVGDTAEPHLWSDEEVLSYLVASQVDLARNTGGIRDSSSSAAQIQISQGEPLATLHASVLKIHGARLASTGRPISVLSYADVYMNQATQRSLPFSFSTIESQGDVKAIITDMDDGKVKVIQIPAADDTVLLIVDRMPLKDPVPAVAANPTATPPVVAVAEVPLEVRAEHHIHLIKGMKGYAYAKQDADSFNPVKSAQFAAEFAAYCAQVQDEKERRADKPRLIAYGGL